MQHRRAIVASALVISGCSFYNVKNKDTGPAVTVDPATMSYAKIVTDVFQPKCFSCHTPSGGSADGINLDTYAETKAKIDLVKNQAIDTKEMPLGGSLDSQQLAELSAWISNGAPELATK